VPFKWKRCLSPGPVSQVNFNDITYYGECKSGRSRLEKKVEVLKWWTSGENDGYWADNSGTIRRRTDAPKRASGKARRLSLAEADPSYVKHGSVSRTFAQ